MSDNCSSLPRFTHAGENYDRWYCQGCGAVMFLPHGEEAPDTHLRGKNILPKATDAMPLPPLREILGMAKGIPAALPVKKLPIEEHTQSLPGDVPIRKETAKS